MSDSILIVDASPLIYRVFNTQGHLATSKGEPTGLRYGFLRGVRSYQERCQCNKVAICFDTKGPVKKAEGIAHYKADRVFTDEKKEMYNQVPALREMLALTKWTQLDAPGYEADDIIGALARAKAQRGDNVVIVSPDNDLCQLLGDERITIFRPGSKRENTKDHYVDEKYVQSRYGVKPQHLLIWRAIVGDASDNLHGIIRENSPAANKLRQLLQTGTYNGDPGPAALTHLVENTLGNVTLSADGNIVTDNIKAMSLHRPDNLRVTKGRKDKKALTELFEKLEFKSMMKFIPEFVGETELV